LWKEIAIVILLILTGSSWVYWQVNSPNKVTSTDAAFKIFVTVIGSALTILVLDQLWFAEEKKKWRKIKGKVDEMCRSEISDIFSVFCLILIPPKHFTIEAGDEEEGQKELMRKTMEHQMTELDRFAQGDPNHIKEILIEEQHLLNADYGKLFEHRHANLNDIKMKYGRFLEPSKLDPIIDLERILESISGNIEVRLKLQTQPFGAALVPSIDDKIAHRVHELLKTLVECKRIGLLKMAQ
jgi:hypothetical protein